TSCAASRKRQQPLPYTSRRPRRAIWRRAQQPEPTGAFSASTIQIFTKTTSAETSARYGDRRTLDRLDNDIGRIRVDTLEQRLRVRFALGDDIHRRQAGFLVDVDRPVDNLVGRRAGCRLAAIADERPALVCRFSEAGELRHLLRRIDERLADAGDDRLRE